MSEDLIRYDILTQDALRTMIAKLLDEVARTGLPGDHHFFITFDTCAPGVQLSSRMKEKYPEEMTIVVQHRFWDLEVKDDRFQIGLSFDEISEILIIPFAAIKGFYDPSVKFGLQFEVQPAVKKIEKLTTAIPADKPALVEIDSPAVKAAKKKSKKQRKPAGKPPGKSKAKPELFEDTPRASRSDNPATNRQDDTVQKDNQADGKTTGKTSEKSSDKTSGAQVVSLDSFRKKK